MPISRADRILTVLCAVLAASALDHVFDIALLFYPLSLGAGIVLLWRSR